MTVQTPEVDGIPLVDLVAAEEKQTDMLLVCSGDIDLTYKGPVFEITGYAALTMARVSVEVPA